MVRFVARSMVLMGILFGVGVLTAVWIGQNQPGETLAFVSNRSGTNQIHILDPMTGISLPVTDSAYASSHPVWKKSAAVIYAAYPRPLHISIADFITQEVQVLENSSGYDAYQPDWSADGGLAVATNPNLDWDIAFYSADYTLDPATFNSLDNEFQPCWWNPDQVSFVSNRTGLSDIYLYDFSTSILTNLTDYPADDYNPACSSDGRLAFTSTRDFNAEVYVMDRATGVSQNVTNHPASDFNPAWMPDGRLSFVSDRDGNREIYILNLATGALTNITHNPADDDQPAWSR